MRGFYKKPVLEIVENVLNMYEIWVSGAPGALDQGSQKPQGPWDQKTNNMENVKSVDTSLLSYYYSMMIRGYDYIILLLYKNS